MLYFSFLYLILLILFRKKNDKKIQFLLVLFPFILIIFLRYGIGADYFSYESIYLKSDPTNIIGTIERMPKIEP
ncbi:MAG: hypothetical protein L0L04_07590, partial [Staphylococcus equorum]|nr:hypothetical protein [Staphylococcus equorum]